MWNQFENCTGRSTHRKAKPPRSGGFVTKGSDSPITSNPFLKRTDSYFMGTCSIDPTIGVTTINYEESEVKKAIVEVSKRVIALTPAERINTAEAFFICPLESVDTVITDEEGKELAEQYFKDSGITVM